MGAVLVKNMIGKRLLDFSSYCTSLGTNANFWVTEKSPVDNPVGGLARRLVLFQERDEYGHD